MKVGVYFIVFLVVAIACVGFASAALVATSQMGYHPDAQKQVVVYGNATAGSFSIVSLGGTNVYSGVLGKARDNAGNLVECQGNNPCLVGDFSNFSQEGNYRIVVGAGSNQPTFSISGEIYEDNVPSLIEFFDAQRQQGSGYHADMHSGYSPDFTIIADGSFIMESHQAAKSLVRLGSAYNRNPEMFEGTDIGEHMKDYTDYIMSLQGLEIETMNPGEEGYEEGFRLDRGVKIENAFVPGPTNMTSLKVYSEGASPTLTDTVAVVSLCGADDGSVAWDSCVGHAADYYKCQVDEVCLNATYIEQTGKVVGQDGSGVATGWSTEFGCYFDVDVNSGVFNDEMNPCLVFDPAEEESGTIESLLGMLEAIPALYDLDPNYAEDVYLNSVNTYDWVKSEYGTNFGSEDVGYWGASLFLLYDYSGDEKYLIEAYALRNKVPKVFVSDETRGNEFYWEEYVRHKSDIESIGTYAISGKDPAEYFEDKMFYDWKDRGATSISRNGERVFQFDNNIRFQNSRFILTEGALASKAVDLNNGSEDFVQEIADNQLAWMTGMNGVQEGAGLNAPVRSYSFIFGISEQINPEEFHSRYLVDTGYRSDSGGEIVGARGTGKQFYNGTAYVYLDGVTKVLGRELGAMGNKYRGEEEIEIWSDGVTFSNGKDFISGWINGAFDVSSGGEDDTIFNYADTKDTYEFTESTNEMVATAIEYFAYRDAFYNTRAARNFPGFNSTVSVGSGVLIINSTPSGAAIYVDSVYTNKVTPANVSVNAGTRSVSVVLAGYETMSKSVSVGDGSVQNVNFVLVVETNQTDDVGANETDDDSGNSGGGSGGGGGGSGGGSPQFSLISVNFEDDFVNLAQNEGQTLMVEASVSRGEITSVSGVLTTPNGDSRTIALTNVNGARWVGDVPNLVAGNYRLSEIRLGSGSRQSSFVTSETFSVVSEGNQDFEDLSGENNGEGDVLGNENNDEPGRSWITGRAISDFASGLRASPWALGVIVVVLAGLIVALVFVRRTVRRKRLDEEV